MPHRYLKLVIRDLLSIGGYVSDLFGLSTQRNYSLSVLNRYISAYCASDSSIRTTVMDRQSMGVVKVGDIDRHIPEFRR